MIHIDSHPPDFISAPWYNLIVRVDNPGVIVTTIGLQAAIASQLGITFTNGAINVRFLTVRVWGALASGTSPLIPINVVVFDTVNSARILEQITDYPDQVRRSCIGYRYPKAHRQVSVRVANTGAQNLLAANGLGANSVIYFSIQWRPENMTPPTFWLEKIMRPPLFSEDEDDDIEVLSVKSLKQRPRGNRLQ